MNKRKEISKKSSFAKISIVIVGHSFDDKATNMKGNKMETLVLCVFVEFNVGSIGITDKTITLSAVFNL